MTKWTPYQGVAVPAVRKKSGKARLYPESDHQMALVKWARMHPKIGRMGLIKQTNEGRSSVIAGARMNAMGRVAGTVDLFLAIPNRQYHGFWIEMKAPGKKPTQEQLEFLSKMLERGYQADWYDNWEKAKEDIEDYLNG